MEAEAVRLLLVIPRADAQHCAATRQDVERGHHLGQEAGGPAGRGCGEGQQPDAVCAGGDVPEGCVRLEVVANWPANDWVEPDVVGDRDRVEPGGLAASTTSPRSGPRRGAPPSQVVCGMCRPNLMASCSRSPEVRRA